MSFNFQWPNFSPSFYAQAKDLLCTALNKGEKPAIIADRIEVKDLDMGTIPPELEILEIGDLGMDRFRGIFRLTYNGDASISLQTKVQANPLRQKPASLDILAGPSILFAASPLIVPMNLRLSALKLRAIVVLVVSRVDGITLVFKNDPLESVSVSSTFDSVAAIQAFVQKEIEGQLRELFRTDLPSIVHKLSQQFVKGQVRNAAQAGRGGFATGAKIHTHSSYQRPSTSMTRGFSSLSLHEHAALPSEALGDEEPLHPPSPPPPRAPSRDMDSSVPDDVTAYDPTYGLRSGYPSLVGRLENYRRLVRHAGMGIGAALSSVAEDDASEDLAAPDDSLIPNITLRVDGDDSYDIEEGPSSRPYRSASMSGMSSRLDAASESMETIPAVGGGTVTRPRVLHSHSSAVVSSGASSLGVSPSTIKPRVSSSTLRDRGLRGGVPVEDIDESQLRRRRLDRYVDTASSHNFSLGVASAQASSFSYRRPRGDRIFSGSESRTGTAVSSIYPATFAHSVSTRPTSFVPSSLRTTDKRDPFESIGPPASPDRRGFAFDNDPGPDDADFFSLSGKERSQSCHLLAALTTSNHTLSPFGRSLSHVASRSTPLPPQAPSSSTARSRPKMKGEAPLMARRASQGTGDTVPVVARRRRLFKIGGGDPAPSSEAGRLPRRRPSSSPSEDGSQYSSYFPRQE